MIYFEQIEFCVSRRHLAIVEHSVLERDSAIHLVAGSETYAMDGVRFLGMRSYPIAILPLRGISVDTSLALHIWREAWQI